MHQLQMTAYLEKNEIRKASISGIGASRKATLISFGIQSAADITEKAIYRIPGFGPSLTLELMRYRKRIEDNFVFVPKAPLQQEILKKIDDTIENKRQSLCITLLNGPAELQRITLICTAQRERILREYDTIHKEYVISKANAKILGI